MSQIGRSYRILRHGPTEYVDADVVKFEGGVVSFWLRADWTKGKNEELIVAYPVDSIEKIDRVRRD